MTLYYKSIHDLTTLIRQREVSIAEVVEAHLERVQAVDGQIKAFVTVNEEGAREKARRLDEALQRGESLSPLAGIPMAYKDNICTKGIRTTCSSKMLKEYIPPYNATVVERLEGAQVIVIGKTNLDEFAFGSSTENSAFFPTHNPWNVTRVPGGSSGGSAAAVAAGEVVASLGSDTGGSIRQPAAFCGIVGLKPTYGAVSRYGLVAFASSLDQIGPLTRNVTDCAVMMNLLAGHDINDSTASKQKLGDLTEALCADVRGIKVGVPQEYFQVVHPEVAEKVRQVLGLLTRLGAEVEAVSLPHTEYALLAYYIIAPAEASSNLARFDSVRYGYRYNEAESLTEMYNGRSNAFGSEVKRRMMLGTYVLSSGYYDAYYRKAQQVRTLIKADFEQAFAKYDVLISPTTPTTAFPLGKNVQDPLAMYQSDLCTVPVNLAGVPALSMPIGLDTEGLPIGLQIIGNHFAEGMILRVAYTLEAELKMYLRHPAVG